MTTNYMKVLLFSRMICVFLGLFVCIGAIAQAQNTPSSPSGQNRPKVGSGASGGGGNLGGQRGGSSLGGSLGSGSSLGASKSTNKTTTSGTTSSTKKRPVTLDGLLGDGGVMIGGSTESQELRVVTPEQAFEPLFEKKIAYGDLPKAAGDDPISMIGPMPAVEFLDALSVATGWNIVASPGLNDVNLDFFLNELTPAQAMGILKFSEVFYEYDSESTLLFVMTKDEYLEREHGDIVRRVFELQHTSLINVEGGIEALLSKKGRMIADPRTSTIVVFDMEENVEHMERLVAQFDLERVSQTYELQYANGGDLFDSVEAMLSESGKLNYDPRSNTLIVLDREEQQKQISMVLRTLDMPVETRSWTLDYANVELVAEHLLPVVPESMGTISYDEDMRQITVTAMASRIEEVEARIQGWDKQRDQVQIEAYLVTVSSAVARKIGINWSFTESVGEGFNTTSFGPNAISTTLPGGASGPVTTTLTDRPISSTKPRSANTIFSRATGDDDSSGDDSSSSSGSDNDGGSDSGGGADVATGLISTFISTKGDLSAMLDVLETNGEASVNAQPRISVLDGQEAVFGNVTQVPFATSSVRNNANNNNSAITTSTRVDFIDVGTILRVLPRITQDRKVWMEISSEDSSFVIRDVLSNDKITSVPEKTQNIAETTVLVGDQETIVIGGLRTSSVSDTTTKIPILGDIPILGRLFRSTEKDHKQRELLIFITPTIIDGMTQPEAFRLAEADQHFAKTVFDDKKGDVHRTVDNFFRRDLFISIGHTGGILADGKFVTLSELRTIMFESKNRWKLVVIRTHPRCPKSVRSEVIEIAMEADRKFKIDDSVTPFVPSTSTED